VWLAEANADERKEWIANLENLAGLDPVTVVAGHKVPEADDDARRVLFDQTRDYVAAFDAAVGQSSSKEELVERVTAEYGDRALPTILDIAAGAAFPG
jgi:CTP:molybdopterin cytidylyltransferase MocA